MQYSSFNVLETAHQWREVNRFETIEDSSEKKMILDLQNSVGKSDHKELMDKAMTYIYKKYGFKLMSIIIKKFIHVDAENILHLMMTDLPRKLLMFKMESALFTYLYRIAVNIVLMELRRNSYKHEIAFANVITDEKLDDSNIAIDNIPTSKNADVYLSIHGVTSINIRDAIKKLPPGYRKIFILHDIEGYEHEEIAKICNISSGTSKSQLHKARYKMRLLLNAQK